MAQRIELFDIMKGIGIILMIVAHTFGPDNIIWDCIYLFHMPLFFVIAGFFYKQDSLSKLLKKNGDQLLFTYIVLCLIIILLSQIRQSHTISTDIIITLNGMGPGWFLLAMFLVRFEFHFILKIFPNYYLIISLIISTSVCFIANYHEIPHLLSFFPSLVSLFFVAIGYYIRIHSLLVYRIKYSHIYFALGLLFMSITLIFGKVEMSQCIFKLSIIDICGSLGGIFFVYKLSKFIDNSNCRIKTILSQAGRYSLVILFFHSIDYCIYIWYLVEPFLPTSIRLFVILVIRLLFVTICVSISLQIKTLRSFFNISNTET